MQYNRSLLSRIFDGFNIAVLFLFAMSTILPIVHIVASSFATQKELLSKDFVLFPTEFTLDAYRLIFSSHHITASLLVTILITVGGTALNLLFTSLMAYPLSRKTLIGRQPIMLMIIFTMLFSGGMIPSFLLVKNLGLLDSLWSLIIPGAISTFNLIVMKNFFQQLPEGIEESAKIDGASDLGILLRIVLPLSLSTLSTFGLFYAVEHWNTFMSAILYIRDSDKWPIQVLLRSFVLVAQTTLEDPDHIDPPSESVKMAVITVATLPILCVYPFLQKHFAKGVLLGSVKG